VIAASQIHRKQKSANIPPRGNMWRESVSPKISFARIATPHYPPCWTGTGKYRKCTPRIKGSHVIISCFRRTRSINLTAHILIADPKIGRIPANNYPCRPRTEYSVLRMQLVINSFVSWPGQTITRVLSAEQGSSAAASLPSAANHKNSSRAIANKTWISRALRQSDGIGNQVRSDS
jgi:hypothetical protein